jgi:hypothetical protein
MRSLAAAAALAVAGLVATGCHGITTPANNNVLTFSGTLPVGGSAAHEFSASKTGEISVKITSLAPVSSVVVGLLWSQALSGGGCSTSSIGGVFQQNNFAQLNIPGISGTILQGKYCLLVYDSGTFTTAETYTVTVSTP